VRAADEPRFRDYHAQRLVNMATDIVCAYLMLRDAQHDARKLLVARHFVDGVMTRVAAASTAVLGSDPGALDDLAVLGTD
jgi:hypothetical protein